MVNLRFAFIFMAVVLLASPAYLVFILLRRTSIGPHFSIALGFTAFMLGILLGLILLLETKKES